MANARGPRRSGFAARLPVFCLWALVPVLGIVSCQSLSPVRRLPDARLAPLQARTELARERRFSEPVDAWEVSARGVEALLAEQFGRIVTPEELAADERLAHVLGLLAVEKDLLEEMLRFQAGAVAGFYAPLERRLYVVVGHPSWNDAVVESVLVHELGHALQAERAPVFDALVGLVQDDDLIFALGALLEGDALFTEFRDEALQTGLPQRDALQHARQMEAERRSVQDIPRLLRDTFFLQYPLGYSLVEALVLRGGIDALDAALKDPPLSAEELLHPERYLQPSKRRPRPDFSGLASQVRPAGCETRSETTGGELIVGIWLEERGLSRSDAERAASGWDGDRVWLFDCPAGEAFAWLLQFDDEAEATSFATLVAEAAWVGDLRRLADGVRMDRAGHRVLVSAGLDAGLRTRALHELEARRHRSLAEYLADHPEVALRAARLRRDADAR